MSTKTDKQMAAVLTAALVIILIGPFSITLAQDATVTSQIASIPRTSSSEVMNRPVSLDICRKPSSGGMLIHICLCNAVTGFCAVDVFSLDYPD